MEALRAVDCGLEGGAGAAGGAGDEGVEGVVDFAVVEGVGAFLLGLPSGNRALLAFIDTG